MNTIIKLLKKSTHDYVGSESTLFTSNDRSRQGYLVPELIMDYVRPGQMFRKLLTIGRWLIPTMRSRLEGYHSLKNNPLTPQTLIDESMLLDLRKFALDCGCHDIGFTEIPQHLVFKDKSVLYSHAIVLSMPMDKSQILLAPGKKSGQEIWRIYDRLGRVSNKIADHLRARGYAAQAGAALGGDCNYPLLAQRAGMGWIGHHGLLISKDVGPSQRLAIVYTSIRNLPPVEHNEYSWIKDFCQSCMRCLRSCPSSAIYERKPIQSDGGPLHIDHLKCIGPFSDTMGCSLCIRDCVLFKGDMTSIHAKFLKKKSSVKGIGRGA